MSKIIRIKEETFDRLQNFAEPLIDTPSTVIDRLLDYYETSLNPKVLHRPKNAGDSNSQSLNSRTQNLFLAPAAPENIEKTIRRSINMTEIAHLLSESEKQSLTTKSNSLEHLNCWAMTESNRSKFNDMQEKDFVTFTIKDSGKFQYYGRVVHKTDNLELGNYLWDFVPTKPWNLVYFLEDLKVIDIDKERFVSKLGYDKNYVVPGLAKVNPIKRDVILSHYGTFDCFISSFEKDL